MDWLRSQPPGDAPVIGTYDIDASAVGYLYLARDAEYFPDIWTLVATMGAAGLATFPTSQTSLPGSRPGNSSSATTCSAAMPPTS